MKIIKRNESYSIKSTSWSQKMLQKLINGSLGNCDVITEYLAVTVNELVPHASFRIITYHCLKKEL
jgi:hypothetical protein